MPKQIQTTRDVWSHTSSSAYSTGHIKVGSTHAVTCLDERQQALRCRHLVQLCEQVGQHLKCSTVLTLLVLPAFSKSTASRLQTSCMCQRICETPFTHKTKHARLACTHLQNQTRAGTLRAARTGLPGPAGHTPQACFCIRSKEESVEEHSIG